MSKLAIITGADGGMGTEITRAVAQAGYHVIMLCYTLFKGEERKNQLILETGNKEIEVRQVDLSSMASVTNIAEDLLGRGKHIDLLMNNAGTMSSGGLITTEDGLEYTVAVNYVGGLVSREKIDEVLDDGFEFVQMGRALLNEPGFVNRLRTEEKARCNCGHSNYCIARMYTIDMACHKHLEEKLPLCLEREIEKLENQ